MNLLNPIYQAKSALALSLFTASMASNLGAKTLYEVPHSTDKIDIDGFATEPRWQSAPWKPIDQLLLGPAYTEEDFQGRFKLLWDEQYLYLLAEIHDDSLSDRYSAPLVKYWDDECLEVFIDEDASGGEHTYNYNAFAYHVALDNQVVDIDIDKQPHLYNDHIVSQWKQQGEYILWELAISVYDDSYTLNSGTTPVTLKAGKNIGFMLAWCDADGQGYRENFIGSEPITGENKDLGYINADVFGSLVLMPAKHMVGKSN